MQNGDKFYVALLCIKRKSGMEYATSFSPHIDSVLSVKLSLITKVIFSDHMSQYNFKN